jgi:hypothetical protein
MIQPGFPPEAGLSFLGNLRQRPHGSTALPRGMSLEEIEPLLH